MKASKLFCHVLVTITLIIFSFTFSIVKISAQANQLLNSIISVNTFDDLVADDGLCSLREAIIAANTDGPFMGCPAGSGDDEIYLSAGTYFLSISGANEDDCQTGDLDIKANLTINGVGTADTIIDAAEIDRVFDVHGISQVQFNLLTITHGRAPTGGTNLDGESGGGIRSAGTLTLEDVSLRYNYAGAGGKETGHGGGGGGIYSSGSLYIFDSLIDRNYAGKGGDIEVSLTTAGDGGHGGGVMALGVTRIENSQITSNQAGNGGSGIMGQQSYMGNAGSGGGLAVSGSTFIVQSEFSRNEAGDVGAGPGDHNIVSGGDGGGIYNTGTILILTSSISINFPGNGVHSFINAGTGGGLHNHNGAEAIIDGGSVFDNRAGLVGVNPRGAGIYNAGVLTVSNTTIAKNAYSYGGGGIYNASMGTIDLNNVTIAYNESTYGGGILNANGTITLRNTLLSWNEAEQGGYDCEGTLTSYGYNFVRDLSKHIGTQPFPEVCFLVNDLTGVITGLDKNPLISTKTALNFYGSLTKNLIPLKNSPLINAGNPATPGSAADTCTQYDQREVERPQASHCDIGAVEATEQFTLTKQVDDVFTYPGQLITFSLTVTNIGGLGGTGIIVEDDLPAGLLFEGPVSLTPPHPEAVLALTPADLPLIVQDLALVSGESVVVTLPVRTDVSFAEDQVITNLAKVFSILPQSEGSGSRGIRTGFRSMLPVILR